MNIERQLRNAENVMHWVHQKLDGLKVPALQTSKRAAIAAGCFHVAVGHQQGIFVLVTNQVFGSALTLIRPIVEAYLRGMWLLYVASDEQVDQAGRDQFPDGKRIMRELQSVEGLPVSWVGDNWWTRLCSYTHTGYQQIGSRLTTAGLADNYDEVEITTALTWANGMALLSVMQFAALTNSEQLAVEALAKLRAVA